MAKRHLYLQWDSTNNCNLDCLQCYHLNHIQDENLMNFSEVKEMLDDLSNTAKRWGMVPRIGISGGEPLMRKDLLDILYHAKKKEVVTALLTNGTLITKEKAKEVYDAGVRRLQISIDGKKETHNDIRRRPFAYGKALEGIVNSSEAGIDVTVSMTLMQKNKNEFEDVIKASIESGVKKVGFKTYVPSIEMGAEDPEYVSAREAFEVFKNTGKLMEKYGDKIMVLNSEVLWQITQPPTEIIREAQSKGTYLTGCSAGFTTLSVLSDGTVYPCRRLPIPIGKINEGISNLIVENEVMQDLRNLKKMEENIGCNKITHCRGCRAVAYAVTGDYMSKDPMCFKKFMGEND